MEEIKLRKLLGYPLLIWYPKLKSQKIKNIVKDARSTSRPFVFGTVSPRKALGIDFIGILAVVAATRCLYAGDHTLEGQLG
jgi:hypothetical protein